MKPAHGRVVVVSDRLFRLLADLPPSLGRKVGAGLGLVLSDPDAGIPLRGNLAGLRCLRFGSLRLVWRRGGTGAPEIVAVGPRRLLEEERQRALRRDRNARTTGRPPA